MTTGMGSVDLATPPVYLDGMGHLWSPDRAALHAMADRIGMRREWFQDRPRLYHYDVLSKSKRGLAFRAGAIGVSPRRLVALIQENDRADPATTVDYLAEKDRSADEQGVPVDRSACPKCGEWRDSPSSDCAACGFDPATTEPKEPE